MNILLGLSAGLILVLVLAGVSAGYMLNRALKNHA